MSKPKKFNEYGRLPVSLMTLVTEMEQLSQYYEDCHTAFAETIYKNGLQSELKADQPLCYYEKDFAHLKQLIDQHIQKLKDSEHYYGQEMFFH